MLLLLSALTGAWAQESPAEEVPQEAPAEENTEPESSENSADGATPEAEGDTADSDMAGGDTAEGAPEPPATPEDGPEPEDAGEPVPAPVAVAGADPTLTLLSPPPTPPEVFQRLAEQAAPYGQLQVWGIGWDQDQTAQADSAGYGDPEDDVGFKIRRARLGLTGTWGTVGYRIGVGYGSAFDGIDTRSGLEIIDASLDYQVHPEVLLRAGVMKVPFGRDNLMSSNDLTLGERSMIANHITPDRDVGVLVQGGRQGLSLQAGLFNGNADLAGDDNPGVLAVSRVSYSRGPGDLSRTFGTVEALTFGVGGNVAYNWDTATRTLAYGVDLGLRIGGLAVMLDIEAAHLTPSNTTVDQPDVLQPTLRDGAVLHVGYTLKDIWEPALRLEWFDDDPTTDGGEVALISAGFAAHLAEDRLQTGLAFVHRQETTGPTIQNDTLRGFVQVSW